MDKYEVDDSVEQMIEVDDEVKVYDSRIMGKNIGIVVYTKHDNLGDMIVNVRIDDGVYQVNAIQCIKLKRKQPLTLYIKQENGKFLVKREPAEGFSVFKEQL